MALNAGPEDSAEAGGHKRAADLAFAGVLAGVGLSAVWIAAAYPRDSAVYPMVIGLALAGLGALIMIRGVLSGGGRAEHRRGARFTVNPARFALGLLLVCGYVAALTRFGFVLPSLLLAVLMPAAAGYRRPLPAGLAGLATVAAIVAIFVVALSRPLPADPVLQLLGLQR
jgi:hypothetical protein